MEAEDEAIPHVVEPISPEDWEQREVYAKFGVAIYFCQCLETQLVNYLALLRRGKTGRPMTDEETDALFDRLFGSTFGRNLSEVRDLLGDQWAMAEELASALNLRNDLVHHWMRDRVLDQGTSKKRQAMIEELDAAVAELQAIDAKLMERTQRFYEKLGIPRSLIEAEYERLSRLAERDDEQEAP